MLEMASGVLVDVEISVNIRYGYDIRGEVVGEDGTAALGELEPGRGPHGRAGWPTPVPADWRERFVRAYDVEFQEWIDAVAGGGAPLGPSAWDGYAAAVVSDAGVAALRTGERVEVALADEPDLYRGGAAREDRPRPVHAAQGPAAGAARAGRRPGLPAHRAVAARRLPAVLPAPAGRRREVAAFKRELAAAEVEVASVLPLYKWSGPDEDERQAAVRYWKRAIEITVDLGVHVMNSEFNGRPEAARGQRGAVLAVDGGAAADLRARGRAAGAGAAPRRLRRGRHRRGRPGPRHRLRPGHASCTARRTPSTRAATWRR